MTGSAEGFVSPSDEAIAVLRLLKHHHNVLITGPSRSGKSRLLSEVRHWFEQSVRPAFSPTGPNAFPAGADIEGIEEWLPSPDRTERKTYSITFHQGTKRRDLIDGVLPAVGGSEQRFLLTRGPLVEAVRLAASMDGAALVEIDELNRGPAVAIFGDLIKAMESDKRLLPDGEPSLTTSSFHVLDDEGRPTECQLPHHVYILGAMNEADTSVEALDVAFLSRFQPYRLRPDVVVIRRYFSLPDDGRLLPEEPQSVSDVLEAAVRAWEKINSDIEIARGPEFQIGHGIFLTSQFDDSLETVDDASRLAAEVWGRLYGHVREVFFGNTLALAEILNAGKANNPYQLDERFFANEPVARIVEPRNVGASDIYHILRSVSASD